MENNGEMAEKPGNEGILAFRVEQAHAEGTGAGITKTLGAITNVLGAKCEGRAIHAKVVRRVWAQMEGIGPDVLDSLAIVNLWCMIHGKIGGGQSAIVSWSGYRKNWKTRVKEGITKGLRLGVFEEIPGIGGNKLCITSKGERVLDLYDQKFAQEVEDMNNRRILKALEAETKRLNKEAKKKP